MSNIVNFTKSNVRNEAEKGLSVKRKTQYCKCVAVEVDEHSRTLECRNCGATVDPFEWAVTMCHEWQSLNDRKKRLKLEIDKDNKNLEDLKRQVRNEKSKLARAKKSSASIPEIKKPELSRDPDTKDWVDSLKSEL